MFATTFGAVAGPNLLAPAGQVAAIASPSTRTGLFLLAAVAYLAAAVVLVALLPRPAAPRPRPGPHHRPARPTGAPPAAKPTLSAVLRAPGAATAVLE